MIGTALSRFRVISLRDLRMHWVRSLVSAGVVAVAAGLLIAVLGTYGSLTGSVERLAVTIAGNASYEVVGVTDSGFDQSELDVVRSVPGVDTAVPLLRSTVRSDVGDLTVLGVDSSITALQSDLQGAVGNAAGLLSDPSGVLVGAATGLNQGDTVTIDDVPTAVVGVIDGPGTQRIGGGACSRLRSFPLRRHSPIAPISSIRSSSWATATHCGPTSTPHSPAECR